MFEPVQENPYPDTHVLGEGPAPHPQLGPVLALLGRWHGRGEGQYPTLDADFRYEQEITFSHDGRPFLRYEARAWLIDGSGAPVRPAGREAGWWRVLPDASLEVVLAHPTGIVETYVGQVEGSVIEIRTDEVTLTPKAKEVTATRRLYTLDEDGLTVVHDMAAVGQPLQHHLTTRLRRRPS
ncbi:FABP family protein [Streptomyces sp. Isolate_45]|uniref:FABP family protein n=1 Tax=unclassified Streptomyces TaxID=2593676 RepID=UPI002481AAEB|nr:FABP family protein [Streptomyces sp. Isolate_45]MDA5282313.1 FABP family protein [Streptomyces sp. Isolate_45]